MDRSDPFVVLPWDSEFFGFPIGKVTEGEMDRIDGVALDRWAGANGIRCVYLLAAPDMAATRRAEAMGFELADVRLILDREILASEGSGRLPGGLREAGPHDAAALWDAAIACDFDTRFTADSRFPQEKAREMYARWATGLVRGARSTVFLAEDAGRIQGFSTASLSDGKAHARLDLIAVLAAGRGKGLGHRLVEAVMGWAKAAGAERMEVVTQGTNIAAQRLYQANGFRTRECSFCFHKWYDLGE